MMPIEALEKVVGAAWHNKAGIYIGPYDVLRESQGRAGKLRFRWDPGRAPKFYFCVRLEVSCHCCDAGDASFMYLIMSFPKRIWWALPWALAELRR